jgi:hypothetical protein
MLVRPAPLVNPSWHYMLEQLMIPLGLFLSPILLMNKPLYGFILFLAFSLHLWNWDKNFRVKSHIPKSVRRIFQ